MLPSSPWPLLRTFVAVFAFTNIVSVQTLTLTGPKYPETNVVFSLDWSGGTPPYTVYVLTANLTNYYYKYMGSELSTTYNFPLAAGTEIAFECRDSDELSVRTPILTVIATLYLQFPDDPQTGVQTNIQWGAGLSPYTAYVLSTDLKKSYWLYTGYNTSQKWIPVVDAGTEVRFQVLDWNGVNVTSGVVTVQANAASSSESALSVLSTMSVASVNSVNSIASISSLSVESTATLTGSAYSSSPTVPPTTSNGTPAGTGSGPGGDNGPSSRANTTTSRNPSGPTGGGGGGGDGGKKTNTAAIAGGVVGGVAGLVLGGALGFFIAHQRGVGHGGTRMADSSHAGFHGGGAQGEHAQMREPALLGIGGGCAPDLGTGTNFGGANAGSGAGAGASGSAGAAATGAAFQGSAQGFPGGAQGLQGGAQGFQGGLQGSQDGIHGAGVGEVPPTPDVQMQYVATPPAPMYPQLQPQGYNDPMSPVSPQGNRAMKYSGMPEA